MICEPIAQIAPRFGGTVEFGAESEAMDYVLPVHASADILDFLRLWGSAVISPGLMAQLPGARVFGSGNVLSPDGRSIARDVSPDFGKPFSDHWLLTFRRIRPPVALEGSVAVIATTLGAGYGHWLLEELPRLLMILPGTVDTIIGHGASVFGREALRLHGFSGRWIEPVRVSHFACEQLVIPVLTGEAGTPSRQTLRRLSEFVAPLHTPPSDFGERIYISRENARRRRVSNEAGLWAQLEARGFRRVHLETLAWAEQIAVFRHARVIVSPHGAGLANLVFCRPGTRVVEFFQRAYVNPCFWRLAALQGLDYRPVVTPGAEPLAYEGPAGRTDIEVDVATILNALD